MTGIEWWLVGWIGGAIYGTANALFWPWWIKKHPPK